MEFLVKVEEARAAENGRPPAGPVYRSIYARNGLLKVPDELVSPWQLFQKSTLRKTDNRMLGARHLINSVKVGGYSWTTYGEVYETAMRVSSAMKRQGIIAGSHCGIYGSNCSQWIIAMEACNSQGIAYVPLYDTLGADAVEFIINHAELSIVFVQENKIPAILSCLPNCPHLKTIVSFGNVSDMDKEVSEKHNTACFSWDEFTTMGSIEPEMPTNNKDDVCTIMYTSGTTGEPKGVVLTNGAMVAEVLAIDHMLLLTDKVVSEEDTYFSFLPLAHVYDQIMENYFIHKGASIGFWQGDVRYLMEDVQELKPTVFSGVPRVFDRIYSGAHDKLLGSGMVKRKLYDFAYNYKLRNLEKGLPQNQAAPFLDKLIFEKVKQMLGGRVRLILSGAAPLRGHVEEFLRVVFCATMSQGYGLTESCGGCFTSIGNVFSMVGTVGVPLTNIEAMLESVPEMGYDALSHIPRGEICLRGSTLFSGYYKREDLTNEALIDGWFHTGDIGEWQANGAMKIIDRKKNIFKLSQGEYVAVENLENTYMQCPLVTSIWIYGNSFESFLVAVAVPEAGALQEWAKIHGEFGDFVSLCNNVKARSYVLDALNSTASEHKLQGFEMLKAVHLEPQPFDVERGLVTPTFKLKRPQLLKFYKDCIDRLYIEAKGVKV